MTGKTPNENIVSTQNYIPGNAVLGYFANRYRKLNFNSDCFKKWFLRDGLRFTPAYPWFNDQVYYHLHLSIQKEKEGTENTIDLLLKETNEQSSPIEGYGYWEDGEIEEDEEAPNLYRLPYPHK